MHLRNVEIFCDVVALASFSKAAEAHDVSQSLASQAVHQLERRLETQLIDRSTRPFELTTAGHIYYDGCRQLLDGFRAIEDRVRQMQDKVVGRVRVAAIYSVGLLQMDTYVKRFEQLYPDASLQVEYLHPEEVYARVVDDQIDLGLVSFPRDGGDISSLPWQEQPMLLVVSPSHFLAGRGSIPVRELAGLNYVAFTPDLMIRKQVDRWLRKSKVAVNVVHEFDNIENIKRAVEIGSGVALLPAPTVKREVDGGSLVSLGLSDVSWHRPLGIVHKRHKAFSSVAAKFVELLHQDPESFPEPEAGPDAQASFPASEGSDASRRAERSPAV